MGAAAEAFVEAAVIEHRSGFRRRWYRTPSFVAGASILGTIVLLALLAPVASWHDPVQQNLLDILQGPSWTHPLGTDELGRDVWPGSSTARAPTCASRSLQCCFRS